MLPAGQVNSSAPPTYGVKPGESLQWRCSVLAGVGDRLVWTLNGVEIPSLDTDYDFQRVCS